MKINYDADMKYYNKKIVESKNNTQKTYNKKDYKSDISQDIEECLRNAGVKLSEGKELDDWEKDFNERNGWASEPEYNDVDWEDATLVPADEEYQRGADEYWRTYLQHKKEVEGLTPDEEEELAELEKAYKRSLN